MSPFAINRRLLWVAAGAVGAGAYLYVRHRIDGLREAQRASERDVGTRTGSTQPSPAGSASGASTTSEAAPSPADAAPSQPGPAGEKELAEFLAGDSWYDESGWRSIWEREGVSDAAAWLRNEGKAVLRRARQSLQDHPALLAGCRRRWIVVCRYAGIDVSDAAGLWNETDS